MERSQRAIVHGVSTLESFFFFFNLGENNCKICVKHSISISIFLIPLQSRVEMVNGVLMIHNVNQSDAGMYQCLAENKYGTIYASAELKILGMPFLTK